MKNQLTEVMTGQQLRSYISALMAAKTTFGLNWYYPAKREAAKQELELFLKSKWRQVEDELQEVKQ